MKEYLRKLMEQEKRELAEIRKKRQARQDMFRQETWKRNEEKELHELRTLKKQILDKLDKEKKKNFQLLIEASVWERVFESKTHELRQMEEELNGNYENIWKSREEFCSQADGFIRDFENFTQSYNIVKDKVFEEDVKEIENDIKNLDSKIAEEEEAGEVLDEKLEMIEKERTSLLEEREGPEFKRLEEWIQITHERCAELESRIARKKERINKKNANLVKSAKNEKNNLFSIVNLDDVKRLSPFKMDPKQSFP